MEKMGVPEPWLSILPLLIVLIAGFVSGLISIWIKRKVVESSQIFMRTWEKQQATKKHNDSSKSDKEDK